MLALILTKMGFTCLYLEYTVLNWSSELSSPYQSPCNYVRLRLIKTSTISSVWSQNYSPTLPLSGKALLKSSLGRNAVQLNLYLSISQVLFMKTSVKCFNLFLMAAFSATMHLISVVKLSTFLSSAYFAETRLFSFEGSFWLFLEHLGESHGFCFVI